MLRYKSVHTPLRLSASIALLLGFFAFKTDYAFACSCAVPGTPLEELDSSTAVFAGRVTNIAIPNQGPVVSTADRVRVTFQVSKVWKGPEFNTLIVNTVRSDISCGYPFQAGQEYLVYVRGPGTSLEASFCSRTQLFESASKDLEALGAGKIPSTENPTVRTIQPAPLIIAVFGLTGLGTLLLLATIFGIRRRHRKTHHD